MSEEHGAERIAFKTLNIYQTYYQSPWALPFSDIRTLVYALCAAPFALCLFLPATRNAQPVIGDSDDWKRYTQTIS